MSTHMISLFEPIELNYAWCDCRCSWIPRHDIPRMLFAMVLCHWHKPDYSFRICLNRIFMENFPKTDSFWSEPLKLYI